MKLVKKNKLTLWNGLIMKGDKVVSIGEGIIHLANTLEDRVQRKNFDLKHCKNCCLDNTNEEFVRVHGGKNYKVAVDTPALDEATNRSLAIMEDIDRQNGADKMNKDLEEFKALLDFVSSDKVLIFDCCGWAEKLDTPMLGNILEWTVNDVYDALAFVNDGFTYDEPNESEE